LEQSLPLGLQIIIAIVTVVAVASPFAVAIYARLNKLIPQFSSIISTVQDVPNQVKTENANLSAQLGQSITSAIALLQRSDDKVERLEEKVSSLELKLADREHKSLENKRQIEELTTTSQVNQKNLQDKVDKLQRDTELMQQNLAKAQEELAKTKADHQQTKAELVQAQERIKALEDERDKERADSTVKIDNLTQELETERGKVKDLQTQLDKQFERITFLEGEVKRLSTPPEPPKEPSAA